MLLKLKHRGGQHVGIVDLRFPSHGSLMVVHETRTTRRVPAAASSIMVQLHRYSKLPLFWSVSAASLEGLDHHESDPLPPRCRIRSNYPVLLVPPAGRSFLPSTYRGTCPLVKFATCGYKWLVWDLKLSQGTGALGNSGAYKLARSRDLIEGEVKIGE